MKFKVLFSILLVSIFLTSCVTELCKSKPAIKIRPLDDCLVGSRPKGFTMALTGGGRPVSWVVREPFANQKRTKVLIQESTDDTSYRFPLCIYDGLIMRNVSAEVKFQAISGIVDEAGGIVLRYTPENYYIARANALEDNINLFKTINGKRLKIIEVAAKVTPHEWHTLRFTAKESHLTVDFDDKMMIDTDDATFINAGKVGLWTKADTVAAFTDFSIERLP